MPDELLKISRKRIAAISADPVKTAKAVNLVYVNDTDNGIMRVKNGTSFDYLLDNKKVNDPEHLDRIKKLVIPPAWQNVWICHLHNGHLQATGLDVKNRKQYRYHPSWNSLRNQTKFYKMHAFGLALPTIRLQLEKDLALPGLPMEKVLATIVSLMERTNIRIGSNLYEKLYGSFGLTTLKDKHVKITGNHLAFYFKGKKGIYHNIDIKSKRLAKIVQQCKDIPGKELFQYLDHDGHRKSIDSGMVNSYIHRISGGDFTAKDFRTWAGTVYALLAFMEIGFAETVTGAHKKVVEVLDKVSSQLGNTRTVCKKYYVNPVIIDLYENNRLDKYISTLEEIEKNDNHAELSAEEKIVMRILENH